MISLRNYVYFLILGFLIATGAVCAEQLRVIGWNVESGGARPEVLDNVIADMQGVDIWGFSEVQNSTWVDLFEVAAEDGENANFNTIFGTTGGGDKLLIVYDENRFELVSQFELDHINIGGNVRAPLVAKMRLRSTGKEFLFMVNHLYRSKADRRHEQAQLLNEWAQNQTLPVIAVGDYNFDWNVISGDADHDKGYDRLTENDVWVWVRPQQLIKTQCSNHNSVLDFVFVTEEVKSWPASAEIFPPDPTYCPDTSSTSDHRLVLTTFEIPSDGDPDIKTQLLERIIRIENELNNLKTTVEQLPSQ